MSVDRFLVFMRAAIAGQPLHREDLGDESSSKSSVLGGMSAATVQLAPQLQQQRMREAAPRVAPRAAPPSMGMGAGGGGPAIRSTGGGGAYRGSQQSGTAGAGKRSGKDDRKDD